MSDVTIVDLGKLAEPANTLINKIAGAIGTLYEPTHIRRIAKAQADADKTLAKSRLEISEIERRGIERLVREEGKKQKNIEAVSSMAIEHLNPGAKPENMDDDWIVHFFEKVRIISDKQMQEIWSRILAGEANSPGRFSRRTLELMSTFDKKDAEQFSRLCSFCWSVDHELIPTILAHDNDIYQRNLLDFPLIRHLNEIGLVSISLVPYILKNLRSRVSVSYFDRRYTISVPKGELSVGLCMFTEAGSQLAPMCTPEPLDDFCEWFLSVLASNGYAPYCPIELNLRPG